MSQKPLSIQALNVIAKSKGLDLKYLESCGTYILTERHSGLTLMEYAPITLTMMRERAWREECNKLKIQR